mmetsp:Transcript_9617/g.30444  ORF Transcript_9617/g.30444 Transcript_9617/m.30444 type:complete len:319 (-) Transcript_9617:856-1812(-)
MVCGRRLPLRADASRSTVAATCLPHTSGRRSTRWRQSAHTTAAAPSRCGAPGSWVRAAARRPLRPPRSCRARISPPRRTRRSRRLATTFPCPPCPTPPVPSCMAQALVWLAAGRAYTRTRRWARRRRRSSAGSVSLHGRGSASGWIEGPSHHECRCRCRCRCRRHVRRPTGRSARGERCTRDADGCFNAAAAHARRVQGPTTCCLGESSSSGRRAGVVRRAPRGWRATRGGGPTRAGGSCSWTRATRRSACGSRTSTCWRPWGAKRRCPSSPTSCAPTCSQPTAACGPTRTSSPASRSSRGSTPSHAPPACSASVSST